MASKKIDYTTYEEGAPTPWGTVSSCPTCGRKGAIATLGAKRYYCIHLGNHRLILGLNGISSNDVCIWEE